MINDFADNADEAFLSDNFLSDGGMDKDDDSIIEDPQYDDDVDGNGDSAVLAHHDNPIIWVVLMFLWDKYI
jgi:hypothetical protein